MVYPPGQGKCGDLLMNLWRRYLEQYAERDGDVAGQIVVAAYHAADIFGFLSLSLDRGGRLRSVIEQRIRYFQEAAQKATNLDDCLVNATFTLYNHLNSLCHQFSGGNPTAENLIRELDEHVHTRIRNARQPDRSAAALRAAFPLLSLIALFLAGAGEASRIIRQAEERFAAGSRCAGTDRDHLINALYRMVEIMQIVTVLSDTELQGQVHQIASAFKEEDETSNLDLKIRNGFCRLFELGHLLATHLDATIA